MIMKGLNNAVAILIILLVFKWLSCYSIHSSGKKSKKLTVKFRTFIKLCMTPPKVIETEKILTKFKKSYPLPPQEIETLIVN